MTVYTKEIDLIAKAGETLQLRIHKLLIKMATDWHKSGDVRPVVLGVNYLCEKLPDGVRVNAVRKWVEACFGFIWNEENKNFVKGRTKGKDLDLTALRNIRWWEFTAPSVYKPINDERKLVEQLVKKLEKDRDELGEKSKVDVAFIASLKSVIAQPILH